MKFLPQPLNRSKAYINTEDVKENFIYTQKCKGGDTPIDQGVMTYWYKDKRRRIRSQGSR